MMDQGNDQPEAACFYWKASNQPTPGSLISTRCLRSESASGPSTRYAELKPLAAA
jgi:hypothetical protein